MFKRQKNLGIKTFNFGAILAAKAMHSSPAAILDFFGLWSLAFGIFLRPLTSNRECFQ
jgi:hypothetical protein